MRRELCEEIRAFAQVKAEWGIGAIKAVLETCLLDHCPKGRVPGTKNKHMVVNGFYRDAQNVKRAVFLGYGLNHALLRIQDVKRLMSSLPTE